MRIIPASRLVDSQSTDFVGPPAPDPSFFESAKNYLSAKFDKLTTPFDTGFTPEATTHAKAAQVAIAVPKKVAAAPAAVVKSIRSAFVPLVIGVFVVLFLVLVTRNLANKVTA